MVAFSSILPDQLGHTLSAAGMKLRFIHRLGKGAYGQVYLAWDMSTPETAPKFFAVKATLKYDDGTEYATLQQQEILFHWALSQHPHVATLHSIVREKHYHYMVMEYYDGGDLFSAIVDRRLFHRNDAAVKRAFVQLIDAVQACHDIGISHRDLKPENVLCSKDGQNIYLTDLGLATRSGMSNSFGCGSGHYMSPECVGSMEHIVPYSPRRSDIWSLGIILVNMLTERCPWQIAHAGRDTGFADYLHDRPGFLRDLLPVSDAAAELLARVLDPEPRTRLTLAQLREGVLAISTFFSADGLSGRDRRARSRSGEEWYEDEAPWADEDDEDSVVDFPRSIEEELVEFDTGLHRRSTSMAGFVSVPLDSSPSQASTFVNQRASFSSTDTGETLPPVTPTSPASELPQTVPTLALDAGALIEAYDEEDARTPVAEDGHHAARMSKGLRRFVGAVRKVAVWA